MSANCSSPVGNIVALSVPIGGNCFVTQRGINPDSERITHKGLFDWADTASVCTVFFKFHQPETFNVLLRLRVPDGVSSIQASIGFTTYTLEDLEYREFVNVEVGKFTVNDRGYVQLQLKGISKTGESFADVTHVIIENAAGRVQYIEHPDNFYFGRRGPSVHLRYKPPVDKAIEYSYCEITVPFAQDSIGCYFMANGFSEGYFGIQVNSHFERRILFSVWSDYETDDPSQVPEDYKVQLLAKGDGVIAQDFGDEGSGMQSYLQYNWESEKTYRFLTYGSPYDEDNSTFTSWFSSGEDAEWRLIASFRKPKKSTYLTALYSFAENFIPETGYLERKALYGNQWVRTADENKWYEVTRSIFTGDATSRKDRSDFAGGVTGNAFFLRHCGFFNSDTGTDQQFIRSSSGIIPPQIDFPSLP